MTTSKIHPTAIIDDGAVLGSEVSVGPYVIIEKGAVVGNGSRLLSHSVIKKRTVLGIGVEVGHFAVVGGDPQHLTFDRSTLSHVQVGDYARLGEGVTIHRSIEDQGKTVVGQNCFLMGNSHVAHDCILGEHTILANSVLLGGHVIIGSNSFLGGGAGVHQFVRIGEGCMLGGLSEITLDIPPQVLVSGRNNISGLNTIGLKRRKIPKSEIALLKQYLLRVLGKGNPRKNALNLLSGEEHTQSQIISNFLNFFLSGNRGFARLSYKTSG